MKNKILSKAYGGVTEARHRLYGLGLPRQWKVITSTLLLLFTFAIGNVLATEVRFLSANKNDANENFAAMSTSSNTTQLVGSGTAKLIAIGSAGLNDAAKQIGYRSESKLDIVFKFDGTASLDIYVNANGSSNRSFELRSFSSTKALSAIVASDYSSATKVTSNVSVAGAEFSSASYSTSAGGGSVSSGTVTMSSSGGIKISYSSLAAGYYVFKSTGSSSSYIYGFDATVSGSVDPGEDDTTAPTLASSVPANSATDVDVAGNIVLTMSENVTIADASKFSISGGAGSLTTASITASGKNVTIPYTGLANSTAYTLTVAANAIQDGAATPNKNAAFSISFTTAAPVVEPDYLLINQSNGNINTTHFRYTGSSSEKSGGYTVDGTKYNRYTQLGGAFTTPVGVKETNKIVSYDAKTNSVTAEAWIFNKASSDYKFYISMIEEGTKTPTIKEFDAPKNSGTKATWTFTPTKNATIYLTVGNNSNVHVCQFGITENGTDLLRGGQIGYSVRLDSCRLANNKNATPFVMDGISYLATSNTVNIWTPGNPVKLKAITEYIKFTLPERAKVSIKATGTYSVTKTEGYSAGASMSNNQDVTLTADTWYICPNGSNVSFVSLEFKTPPTMRTISFDSDGGSAVTAIQVEDGTPATKPADPTWEHHRFAGWYNGATPYDWTANVTGDLTLTAHWTQLYTISFAAGDGSGDAPEAVADKAQGETFPVPANTYTAPGTKVFAGWNDGTNDYAPGDTYTVGTNNVVLTAQWVADDYEAKIGTTMYATFAEALAHAADGEIVLLQDINVTSQIEIAAGVTAIIDLAGHKIEYTGSSTLSSGVILVHNGGTLTINDSSNPSTGKVVAGEKAYAALMLTKAGDGASQAANLTINGGTFTGYYYAISGNGSRPNTNITINGGTLNATATNDNLGIYHPQNGTLTINGGTITGYASAIEMRAGTLVINDGTFTATATEFSCNPNGSGTTTVGAAIAIAQHTTKKDISVTINGGTFTGEKALNESNPQANDPAPQVTMAVKDGNFVGEVSTVDVNHFISGGTFDAPVAVANCAENYAPKSWTDGTGTHYGVKPLATSIDFEDFIDDQGTTGDWATYLSGHGYAISSTSDVSLDGGESGSKPADKGLKIKKTGRTITFEVAADKLVTLKVGSLKNAGASISVNGGAYTALESANPLSTGASVYTYYHSNAVANYSIKTNGDDYCIIQSIKIEDPYVVTYNANGGDEVAAATFYGTALTLPSATKGTSSLVGWFDAAEGGNKIGDVDDSYIPTADITLYAQWEDVSTDARLASITFSSAAGTLVPAFDPEVVNYTYTMPYGTAAIPQITGATAVNAGGSYSIVSQASAWDETAVIRGVAASSDTKAYNITMKLAPKDGICLVEADLAAGSSAASITATTGAYKDADNIAINVAKDLKLGEAGNYVKVAVKDTYFQDGDIVELVLRTDKPASAWLQIFADEGTTLVAEMTSGVSTTAPNRLTISGVPANTSVLYLYRTTASATNMNPYPTSMAVYRSMNPVLKSITFDGTKVNVTSTSVAATLPHGADLTAVTAEYYWNGAGTAVVTTNEGAWAWGANTYVLTDKDGDATTYTITLTEADHYEAMIVGGASYSTLAAAVAAAQADDVVKLLDNVDLMATGLTIAENITLDLNGFNIKAGEQIDNDIVVPAGKKLTLVDNSANAEGKIYTEQAYTGAVTGYGLVRVSGELLMQSGNIYAVIDSDPANLGQFAVVLGAGGKATIEGGQIKAGWYAISNNGNNTGSTIIVSGGELISTADYAIYNPAKESTVTVSGGVVYGAAGGIAMNRGELTVTGGTITSKDQGTTGTWGDGTGGLSNAAISASGKYESVEVEISGGTIIAEGTAVMITNGTTNPVEVAISGGQFSHVVPAEYCAEGFAPVTEPNAQGKYEVEDKRIYIFDGSTMSNIATSPSGAISWEIVGSTMGAGDKDKTYEGVHYTRALSCGSSSTTKHFRIDVALNNAAKIEVIGMSNSSSDTRHAWLTNSTEKGEYASAIAGLATTGYNPEMFATDWLEEGSYYLHADNTVAIFLIRVTPKTVPAKCEAPTITDMANSENCEGTTLESLSVSASVTDGGTLHYQWYKEEGATDVAVGTDAASYTPDAVGEYYVVVTNRKADMRDHSAVSNTITVSYVAAAQITTAPLNQRGEVDDVVTLSVVATGKNLSYKWFKCDDESGTNPVAIDPEETNASLNVTITAGMNQWYKVLVTSDCGNAEATARVSEFVPATPANVTESIVWDWESSAWPASGQVAFTDQVEDGTDLTPAYELLADADAIVPNNAAFRSDMLYGKGQWVWRSGNKFFQGTAIKFTTEVAGLVRVNYRSTGNNKEVQVTIAGTPAGKNKTSNFQWSEYVEVPAGAVEILCLATDANKSLTRVQKIEFLAVGHERTVVVGDLGTVCLPNASIARGVTVYEYQGADEIGKIVFDELGANDLLEAGKPYIFQVNETNARFYYNTDPAVGTPDNSTALKGNLGATITFQPGSAEAANVYFVKDHAFWMAKNTGVKIGQYRAYLQMDEVSAVTSSTPAPGRRRISMAVNGEQIATGIENTGFESEAPRKVLINGELYIIRGEKMYDAKGQLVK